MANIYNIENVTYEPSRNPEWFAKALLSGRLISGNYIGVLPNVKKSMYLNSLAAMTGLLQKDDNSCGWNPTQMVKLSQKLATVQPYKIQGEECLDRLESIFLVNSFKAGANNTLDTLPTDFTSASMEQIAKEVNAEIEKMLIAGDSAKNANQIDGLVKQLTNATDKIKIAGSTLTKANVISELEKVYAAIPAAVLGQETENGVKIFASFNTVRALKMALANVSNQVINTEFSIANDVIKMYGIEIVPVQGMDDATMVAIATNNCYLLTDMVSDFSNISLQSMPFPNEDKIGLKGRLRLGLGILFTDEAVLYAVA